MQYILCTFQKYHEHVKVSGFRVLGLRVHPNTSMILLCMFKKYHEHVKVSWIMDSLVVEYVHDTTMHVQKYVTNMSKYHGLCMIH